MITTLSIHYSKMQLNDVIKRISWDYAFVALLIQTNINKNSINTDTSIGISASLYRAQLMLSNLGQPYASLALLARVVTLLTPVVVTPLAL